MIDILTVVLAALIMGVFYLETVYLPATNRAIKSEQNAERLSRLERKWGRAFSLLLVLVGVSMVVYLIIVSYKVDDV